MKTATYRAHTAVHYYGLSGAGDAACAPRANFEASTIEEIVAKILPSLHCSKVTLSQHNASCLDILGKAQFEGDVDDRTLRPCVSFDFTIIAAPIEDADFAAVVLALREAGKTVAYDRAPSAHGWVTWPSVVSHPVKPDAEALATID